MNKYMKKFKGSPGEWFPGCLISNKLECDCGYVFAEGYMGCVAEVHVDNGLPISEGGTDDPPREEARANLLLLSQAKRLLFALTEIKVHEKEKGQMKKDQTVCSIASEAIDLATNLERHQRELPDLEI